MTTLATKTIVAVQNYKKTERGFWTDIGSAVVNPNGTIDLTFDVFPVGEEITIQVRDRQSKDERPTEPAPANPRRQIVAIITEARDGQQETRVINLGIAFANKDASYNLKFNYIPLRPDAHIQIRDFRKK